MKGESLDGKSANAINPKLGFKDQLEKIAPLAGKKEYSAEEKLERIKSEIRNEIINATVAKRIAEKLNTTFPDKGMDYFYKELSDLFKNNFPEFKKRIIETWNGLLVVHGKLFHDSQTRNEEIEEKTDLDGQLAIFLWKLGGFDSSVKYVKPGTYLPGHFNVDTGNVDGLSFDIKETEINDECIKDKNVVVTGFADHHGKKSDNRSIMSSKSVFLALSAINFLDDKDENLLKTIQIISQDDRGHFSRSKEIFEGSERTIWGLRTSLGPEGIYRLFKKGYGPNDPVSDEDILELGLSAAAICGKRKNLIKNSREMFEQLNKSGFILESEYGKIVLDFSHRFSGGAEAALAYGCEGYLNFSPIINFFFISAANADFTDKDLPNVIKVRKNMILQNRSKKMEASLRGIFNFLGVKHSDLLDKIVDLFDKSHKVVPVKGEKNGEVRFYGLINGFKVWLQKGFDPKKNLSLEGKVRISRILDCDVAADPIEFFC